MGDLLLILGIIFIATQFKKMPDLMKTLGSSVKEFKKALNEDNSREVTEYQKQLPGASSDPNNKKT